VTNHKNSPRSKKLMKAATATGIALMLAGSGAIAASAADAPPVNTAPIQAEIDAATKGAMTGKIISIDVQDDQEAFLASIGIVIDENGSVAVSNERNAIDPSATPYALLMASFNEANFTANSEFGSKVSNPRLGLVSGDNSFTAANVLPAAATPVPNNPIGALFNPWNELRNSEGSLAPGALTLASVMPGASWTNGGVANDLNGNTESNVSTMTQSWTLDGFAPTAQRQADLSQNGTQRADLGSGLLDCSNGADCIVKVTPVVSGDVAIDENGNTQQGTMAIGGPITIHVKSTLAAAVPTHTEANPYVDENGNKVYFKAKNEGTAPVITSTDVNGVSSQSYNLLNPSVAIKPWKFLNDANREAGWNNPEISDLYVDGNTIVQQTSSSFAGTEFVSNVTDGANGTKTVTVTSDNAELGDNWQYQGNVLTVGQKIAVGTLGEATVGEATKGKLVLSYTLNAPDVSFKFTSATIGTQVGYVGYGIQEVTLPGYEMVVVPGEAPVTPVVPVPSETPVPTPSETPTPTVTPTIPAPVVPTPEVTTSTVVIPDEAATDGFQMDDLAETGAKATSVWATMGVWALGAGVALLAGLGIMELRARRLAEDSK
jgi:hypothetical protein